MLSIPILQSEMAASVVPFVIVEPAGGKYVQVYPGASIGLGKFASVNAGNSYAFFVGGAGLNAAFASAIANPQSYQALQTGLYNSASSTFSYQQYPPAEPVQFAMVRRPGAGTNFYSYEGTVFIDIFQPGTAPAGNPDNYGMIYVCPPDGANYSTDSDFLNSVEATAQNLISAIREYNLQLAPANGLAAIEVIRLFLFSSGIYRFAGVGVGQVAQAVCSGILAGLNGGPAGLKSIQLPSASGEYAIVASSLNSITG